MTLSLRILLARTGAATLLAGGLLFGPLTGVARAEDGDDTANIEEEIRAQADKILQLMRENERAILAASLGSGKKPDGVDVKPPPVPESEGATDDGASPPPSAGKDDDDAARGQDIGRKIEELIRTTQDRGGTIPSELEALVRMIPT